MGGIQPAEMNLLELEFLRLIRWDLWVEPDTEYDVYLTGVLSHYSMTAQQNQMQTIDLTNASCSHIRCPSQDSRASRHINSEYDYEGPPGDESSPTPTGMPNQDQAMFEEE